MSRMSKGLVQYFFDLGSSIKETADGIFTLLTSTATNVKLQFGGATNAFPAWVRSTTLLRARLADDSSDTAVIAGSFIASQAPTSGGAGTVSVGGTTATTVGAAGAGSALPATPTGYVNINVGGSAKKIPYYEP